MRSSTNISVCPTIRGRPTGGSAKVCGDAHPRPLATGSGTVATGASEKVDQTSSAERAKLSTASGEPVCECERSESALQRTLTSCRKDSSARRPHRRTSSLTRDGARRGLKLALRLRRLGSSGLWLRN